MSVGALADIGEEMRHRLEATNAAREAALVASRHVIRLCATSIRATHRGELDDAARLAGEARELLRTVNVQLEDHPAIYWSGYVLDAQKELAEAHLLLGLVGGWGPPSPGDLEVEVSAYLNGLGETAGELRRYALDRLRQADLERAAWALEAMDEIYSLLVTVDFPDAITGGLRRTTDMVRGVLERTRGDVTVMGRQRELEEALARFFGERDRAVVDASAAARHGAADTVNKGADGE